jgi:hypothetical protein
VTAAIELPARMRKLPKDPTRPYVVPWFVAWVDGKPDFRIIRADGIGDALRLNLCWLCGEQLGAYRAFTIGPMCAVNRTSAEPPSHRDCAVYAAQVCPFLTTPTMQRRERGLDELGTVNPAGEMIRRNPGVALVWVSKGTWRTYSDRQGGLLFDIGGTVETLWFAHGRAATRDEVLASIDSGLPLLREMAEAEGPRAIDALERMHQRALDYVPA